MQQEPNDIESSDSDNTSLKDDKFRERFPEKKNILNAIFRLLLKGFRSFFLKICPDNNIDKLYDDLGLLVFEETYNIHKSLREGLFSIYSSEVDCKAYLSSIISKDHSEFRTKTNKQSRVTLF